MASNARTAPAKVPAAMLAEKRAGWNGFLLFTKANCIALAVFLLLMLLFFKIL